MKPKDVLQPCPFCGLHVELVSAKTYPNGERSPAYIKCKICNYHIAGYEDKDVINQWNTRSAIRKEFCPNCETETPCTHEELYLDEDFRMLAKTYPADVSTTGVTTLVDYVEALEAELARRDEELKITDGLLKEATETIGAIIACCTYNSNDDAKIGIYGIDQKAFTMIDQFITHYNDAVSAGKVSVDVKPVKREKDYQNDNRTNTGG